MTYRKTGFFVLFSILTSAGIFALGGGEQRPLRYALSGNPDTLDPHKTAGTLTFMVIKSVYDTLAEPDENGKLVPALAESWKVSEDGKLWTFRLRENVTFHDGTPFTSKDVKATMLRLLDKNTASPHSSEFGAVADIGIPDDYTVEFRLHSPSAPFLASLSSGWAAILPASLIAAGHDFGSKPVGTGPFAFEEWIRDNKITLKKNPSYWMSGKPKLTGVDFRIIPERAVQVQGLISGQLDVCDLYDNVDVPILERNAGTKVEKNLTSLVMVLAMNTSRPLLNDLRVRQAVNLSIDKQRVLDIAYGGGIPGGTFMDHGDPYYKDFTKMYPYNPDRARSLFAGAGVGKDDVLEMVLPQNFEPHVRAGQLYQEMLAKTGLTVKIRLVDWSTWLSDVHRNGNYDLTVIGHTGKLDPDIRLSGYGTERMYVKWVNLETAKLIAEARTLSDFALRKSKYDRILEIIAREVPFVFTGTSYRYIGMRKNVDGFRMQPKLDAPDFRAAVMK